MDSRFARASESLSARVPRRSGARRAGRITSRNESMLPTTLRMAFFSDNGSLASGGFSAHRTASNKKTYYWLKMFSSAKFKGFKIQVSFKLQPSLCFLFLTDYIEYFIATFLQNHVV